MTFLQSRGTKIPTYLFIALTNLIEQTLKNKYERFYFVRKKSVSALAVKAFQIRELIVIQHFSLTHRSCVKTVKPKR